ncbi:MAG: EamA family transporter [Gluconacetobacter diazotrophicus]|nr:EamA family transporter [Gluconacetobacter diazotrophicus]
MVCVQLGAVQAKLLFPVLGTTGTAGLRVLFAAVLLLPFLRRGRERLRLPGIAAIGAYGICLAAMNAVFYAALDRLPLGPTVAIEFLGPLALALLGSRRWPDLCWIGLAVLGLAFLLQPWRDLRHGFDPVGGLLALGAGGCWALYILAGRRLGRHVTGIRATALGMGVAAAALLPFSLPVLPDTVGHPRLLLGAIVMALASSAIPYSIEMIAMRRLDMRVFAILMSLEPVIAALAGLFMLGESLSAARWLAVLAIVAASLGSALTDPVPPEIG